ncbi:MAG TPA: outer membrane beta-barrel protein [Candidatus Eisenbacteria bacterium]
MKIRNGLRMGMVAAVMGLGTLGGWSPAALAAPPADQQREASLGFKGLGASLGLVDPEGASSTVSFGVHIDGGEFVRNVHLTPLVEYWKVGVGGSDLSDFALGTDVTLDFPLQNSRVVPYAGGGLGINWLKVSTPLVDNSDTKLGLNLLGGIRNDVMPNFSLFGELRYNFVSDANQLKILGGFTYHFIY